MSAMATVQAPLDYDGAVELGNRAWAKRILPIGEIAYKGRTLKFTPDYLGKLVDAFHDRAYDYVPFQLADAQNNHTNDPERYAGQIEGLELREDGLWALARLTERGQRVLQDNPNLGVSARIVEQYDRADGKHYTAAIQHVLGTHDPRVTSLGSWQPVDMANESEMVIDLSGASWAGEDTGTEGELTDEELQDLIDAMADVEDEGQDPDDLSDEELDAILAGLDGITDEELAEIEAEADVGLAPQADDFEGHLGQLAATGLAREAADVAEIELGPVDQVSGLCLNTAHQAGCRGYLGGGDEQDIIGLAALYEDDGGVLDRARHAIDQNPRTRVRAFSSGTIELAAAVGAQTPDLGVGGDFWADLLAPERGTADAYAELMRELEYAELDGRPDFGPRQGHPDVSGWRGALGI